MTDHQKLERGEIVWISAGLTFTDERIISAEMFTNRRNTSKGNREDTSVPGAFVIFLLHPPPAWFLGDQNRVEEGEAMAIKVDHLSHSAKKNKTTLTPSKTSSTGLW